MSNGLPRFMMIRCDSCKRHLGMFSKGSGNCRFCGAGIDSTAVIARTDDASELQSLVSEHNLPEGLSEQFSAMKSSEMDEASHRMLKPEQAQAALSRALGEGETINLSRLRSAIRALGSSYDASRLAAEAEAEGLLMQVSEGEWLWLG